MLTGKSFWKMFALFLLGAVLGFAFSPIKQGMSFYMRDVGNTGNYGEAKLPEPKEEEMLAEEICEDKPNKKEKKRAKHCKK